MPHDDGSRALSQLADPVREVQRTQLLGRARGKTRRDSRDNARGAGLLLPKIRHVSTISRCDEHRRSGHVSTLLTVMSPGKKS